MRLISNSFAHQAPIPAAFTCRGQNVNPHLRIEDTPPNIQSLALIMHDPDAPGRDFTHWVMWNIDPLTTDIAENSLPATSVQGVNDFRALGYGGPCPPSGTHHYVFELFALGTVLDLPEGSSRAALETAMKDHIIDRTLLTGLFNAS